MCLNICIFILIFLYLRFYLKEEDFWNDGVCYFLLYVEKNVVFVFRKRVILFMINLYYKDVFFWFDDGDF